VISIPSDYENSFIHQTKRKNRNLHSPYWCYAEACCV